ncbi:ATP-binding cassette transporter [Mycena chlorophos]|uniref:ATP-binding cassette transporter n=1 Tax=Mycena chlorophos TaxID=658473 RepID=A0A8H6SIP6_MYCCL|nr:ATP-binding cassette transporter [Mycena chlorophos]
MDFLSSIPQAPLGLKGWVFGDDSGREAEVNRQLLLLPAYVSILSALVLVFSHSGLRGVLKRSRGSRVAADLPAFEPAIGFGAIWAWRLARVVGCIALFGISLSISLEDGAAKTTRTSRLLDLLLMDGPYLYATLSAFPTLSTKHYRQNLVRHTNAVLLTAFAVYAYRDIIPLATFTLQPLDHGAKFAAKLSLLAFTSIVVPLLTPRLYIPIDPENPQKEINPEQTAPLGSFILYSFLDNIIWNAYRQSGLQEEQLYPMCDTDGALVLKERAFKHLDVYSGAKRRYLFFGLMRVYWREFSVLVVLILLRPVANYANPYAMNRLLEFIETRDQAGTHVVRPWVWIVMIGAAPLFNSVVFQLYIFINTRTLVRTESILTQLLLAHSLRIRMKAELDENKEKQETTPATPQPEPASASASAPAAGQENVRPASSEGDETESATVHASSASVKSAKSVGTTTTTTTTAADKKADKKDPKKGPTNIVGRLNNLITSDLASVVDSRDFLVILLYCPAQIILGIYFLYVLLGNAVWVGVASILLLAPAPGYMARQVQKIQKQRMKRTDARISTVSEAVNVLRMVKLFGWEGKMGGRISDKARHSRSEELIWIRKRRLLDLASNIVVSVIPVITMVLTFGTYTLIMRQPLTASKVFSSMTIFDFLRDTIFMITRWLNNLMNGKVSLDRVDDFLKNTELLDEFSPDNTVRLFAAEAATDSEEIGFRNATFSWYTESDGALSRSQRQFQLRIPDEVLFKRGKINLVVGPTGSGKTSLLMALLGEMHYRPSSPDSWFNLPRSGGVGYAAQELWVLNETIRDNITFATPYDEERYKKVLYQCALEPDLALFQAGDQTKKARLTLARAVYSKAAILLLDDVFAALDVHTAQHIVDNLFRGELIADRTVILVTHNIALTRPIADYIVTFGSDGRIQAQGTVSEITSRGPVAAQIRVQEEALDKQQAVVDPKAPEDNKPKSGEGKLIVAEEVQLGHVSASALGVYFKSMGGKHPIVFFIFFYGTLLVSLVANALRTWVLGYWASQYDNRPSDEVDVVKNLGLFTSTAVISTASVAVTFVILVVGQLRASRIIHTDLIQSILSAPLRWLDVTPVSRIIARVTNDIRAVDDSIPNQIWPLSDMILTMFVRLGAIVLYAPVFFFPGIAIGAFGAWIGQVYIAGQLPVKRLHSNTRAPVIAHFGAAISGLVSVRAFAAQDKIKADSIAKIDRYTRAARSFYNLNRWVSVRVDILGGILSSGLTAYLVYIRPTSAGDMGFVINMCMTATQMLLWAVRSLNDFEVQGNSLERIQGYIEIDHEKPATVAGTPPAYWPSSGDLVVENLTARYSADGPAVLHGISFRVKAGERVGIVGRTGSGKSSLTLSLLRCIPTEGSVRYDGLDTSQLNLDALRSSITIIPQVPELLSGTLRSNLDPFGQYDDAELNAALRASGLFSLQSELDEGRITLDSVLAAGGTNLSVGQRQIFALARAIVRRSKILILDEATSAIGLFYFLRVWLIADLGLSAKDYKTDSIIQTSLREELGQDVSLLTVAHRLQTIMDNDKIMVLDAGKIVEYGSPKELLGIEGGRLRALVDESGDKDILYEMAGAAI